jgi:hypothetical protein
MHDNKGRLWSGIACSACSGCHDLYLADDCRYREGMKMTYTCPTTGRLAEWSAHCSSILVSQRLSSFAELNVA